MTLNIGTVLRDLRSEHHTTQEQLAAHLGVTPQAISRWEAATGYPDITLLPAIADYFAVTVDDLLGLDRPVRRARLREIHDMIALSGERAGLGEEETLLEEARGYAAEFPTDELVRLNLADSICRRYMWQEQPPLPILREAERIYRAVIERTTDDDRRCSAISALASLYVNGFHDIDRAIAICERLPSIKRTREWCLARLIEGERGLVYRQQYIAELVRALVIIMRDYTVAKIDNGRRNWDMKVEVLEQLIALMLRVFGEDAGDYHGLLAVLYRYIATYRVAQGRLDETLNCLEAMAHHAVAAANVPDGTPYTTPFADHLVSGSYPFGNAEVHNDAWYCLERMAQERYDPVRENARFAAVVAALEGAAT